MHIQSPIVLLRTASLSTEKFNWTFQVMATCRYYDNRMLHSSCMQKKSQITSVWKVQFQHLEHFPVANNELFHMVSHLYAVHKKIL